MTKIAAMGMKGSTTVLRQAMLLLAVVDITATMVMAAAAPAFAGGNFACTNGVDTLYVTGSDKQDLVKQGYTCDNLGPRRR